MSQHTKDTTSLQSSEFLETNHFAKLIFRNIIKSTPQFSKSSYGAMVTTALIGQNVGCLQEWTLAPTYHHGHLALHFGETHPHCTASVPAVPVSGLNVMEIRAHGHCHVCATMLILHKRLDAPTERLLQQMMGHPLLRF